MLLTKNKEPEKMGVSMKKLLFSNHDLLTLYENFLTHLETQQLRLSITLRS